MEELLNNLPKNKRKKQAKRKKTAQYHQKQMLTEIGNKNVHYFQAPKENGFQQHPSSDHLPPYVPSVKLLEMHNQ